VVTILSPSSKLAFVPTNNALVLSVRADMALPAGRAPLGQHDLSVLGLPDCGGCLRGVALEMDVEVSNPLLLSSTDLSTCVGEDVTRVVTTRAL